MFSRNKCSKINIQLKYKFYNKCRIYIKNIINNIGNKIEMNIINQYCTMEEFVMDLIKLKKNGINGRDKNDSGFSIDNLKGVSFFKYFNQEEWAILKNNLCNFKYEKDENILLEGDKEEEKQGIYVVSNGSVSVSKSSLNGRYYHVRVLEQGELFINPGLFDGGPSPATLKAIEDTQIFYIPRNVILPIISKNNKVSEGIYLIVAEIIRSAISVIDGLAFKDNYSRLASFLINVSKKDVINRNQFSLQFISSCINTVPEVVSRGLKKMADDGIIEITRTKLIVKDREGLEDIASE